MYHDISIVSEVYKPSNFSFGGQCFRHPQRSGDNCFCILNRNQESKEILEHMVVSGQHMVHGVECQYIFRPLFGLFAPHWSGK